MLCPFYWIILILNNWIYTYVKLLSGISSSVDSQKNKGDFLLNT